MTDVYRSHGKGYMEIVRDAKKMLQLAMAVDSTTGDAVLTSNDILTILQQVDDEAHFRDPLACALLDFIMERNASIVLEHPSVTSSGTA